MSRDAFAAFGVFLVVVVLGAGVVAIGPWLLGAAAGPEAEILTILKRAESSPPAIPIVSDSPLLPTRLRYDRLAVSLVEDGSAAVVTCTLDLEGAVGKVRVSSLGHERVRFERRGRGGWEPVEGLAPRLSRALAVLMERRGALEAGGVGDLAHLTVDGGLSAASVPQELAGRRVSYAVKAWFLRGEREGFIVREEHRLTGWSPDRPLDDVGATRLFLVPRDGRFFFSENIL